ncbi:MAG: hypothetical protein ACOYXW_00055, partial [Actinomycetota bacterium]
EQLTAMLTALSDLGVTATRVIEASQEDTVANLRALDPVLTQLAASGDALTQSLELFLTYPFSDSAVEGIRGDYTNLQVTADLDFQAVCLQLGRPGCEPPAGGGPPAPPDLPGLPDLPDPTEPVCELVGGVLPDGCDAPLPGQPGLPVPGQPGLPGLGTGQDSGLGRLLLGGVG